MNLKLKGNTFIVCGATSGFGRATAEALIQEEANIIAIARTKEKLIELSEKYPDKVKILTGDITKSSVIDELMKLTRDNHIGGILVNAGGPPAGKFKEFNLTDWDSAYQQVVRWKIELTRRFLPIFEKQGYGRFLFIESSAVKQPIENLILSTSMRMAVAGFVKSLSQEIPDKGVTFNIIAPGYHYTQAVERLIKKKSESENIPAKTARQLIENAIPMKRTGDTAHLATLAVWLLSPLSDYVTGQIFTVDGGIVKSTL